MVNLDTETRDALRSLAFTAGVSQSNVAADALRMLVPMMAPVVNAMAKVKQAPHQAMADLAAHAELVDMQAQKMLKDVRQAAREAVAKTPPSSNTGG
jgi:hypothetical protein